MDSSCSKSLPTVDRRRRSSGIEWNMPPHFCLWMRANKGGENEKAMRWQTGHDRRQKSRLRSLSPFSVTFEALGVAPVGSPFRREDIQQISSNLQRHCGDLLGITRGEYVVDHLVWVKRRPSRAMPAAPLSRASSGTASGEHLYRCGKKAAPRWPVERSFERAAGIARDPLQATWQIASAKEATQ
ncbi:hypothetical protein ABIE33_006812 [Ensifer sp. 4252]